MSVGAGDFWKKFTRRPVVEAAVITVLFAGFYLGLRGLPNARCGFLHYETTEVLADGTEVCAAVNHASFVDLTAMEYPVRLVLEPEGPMAPGRETVVRMRLETAGGERLLPHELAVTHTERLHLLVIDPVLEDYHHLHPAAEGAGGDWVFSFRPERTGNYRFLAEIVPVRTRRQSVAEAFLEVARPGEAGEGAGGSAAGGSPAGIPAGGGEARSIVEAERAGHRFVLAGPETGWARHRENPLVLRVERADGGPVNLEPVMGAAAHLVAFDEGGRGYAHLHPLQGSEARAAGAGREVDFLFYSTQAGRHRLWAQVKLEGREVFVPFDVVVAGR